MNIVTLLPFIVLIGAMFLMTRSAKKKQQQAANMRDSMQPGTGVRTIGGMYATVKEIRDDTVLLEVAPGVHALYAKNAIGAVLEAEEFDRILNGQPEDLDVESTVIPDDASSLTADEDAADRKADLTKEAPEAGTDATDTKDAETGAASLRKDAPEADAEKDAEPKDVKRDGDTDK
ncbi:preprotein translocase subunit YajC [Streptomyces daliensis]|uniref:Preprotein translocase subunit YajC n=1 Tax=Streptomyces daliensis TaxID=299421 RepID=A0A8T4IYS6_9ACTN|nr:preprotein translocase subunit YajC [Streptomyces daliensis]